MQVACGSQRTVDCDLARHSFLRANTWDLTFLLRHVNLLSLWFTSRPPTPLCSSSERCQMNLADSFDFSLHGIICAVGNVLLFRRAGLITLYVLRTNKMSFSWICFPHFLDSRSHMGLSITSVIVCVQLYVFYEGKYCILSHLRIVLCLSWL